MSASPELPVLAKRKALQRGGPDDSVRSVPFALARWQQSPCRRLEANCRFRDSNQMLAQVYCLSPFQRYTTMALPVPKRWRVQCRKSPCVPIIVLRYGHLAGLESERLESYVHPQVDRSSELLGSINNKQRSTQSPGNDSACKYLAKNNEQGWLSR